MVDILISNIRVIRTIRGYVTYTDKYHHGLSANILTNKWGICLDKAYYTLESTTKYNFRSYIKKMTQLYRTD